MNYQKKYLKYKMKYGGAKAEAEAAEAKVEDVTEVARQVMRPLSFIGDNKDVGSIILSYVPPQDSDEFAREYSRDSGRIIKGYLDADNIFGGVVRANMATALSFLQTSTHAPNQYSLYVTISTFNNITGIWSSDTVAGLQSNPNHKMNVKIGSGTSKYNQLIFNHPFVVIEHTGDIAIHPDEKSKLVSVDCYNTGLVLGPARAARVLPRQIDNKFVRPQMKYLENQTELKRLPYQIRLEIFNELMLADIADDLKQFMDLQSVSECIRISRNAKAALELDVKKVKLHVPKPMFQHVGLIVHPIVPKGWVIQTEKKSDSSLVVSPKSLLVDVLEQAALPAGDDAWMSGAHHRQPSPWAVAAAKLDRDAEAEVRERERRVAELAAEKKEATEARNRERAITEAIDRDIREARERDGEERKAARKSKKPVVPVSRYASR
jgi:hypothetical protein